MENVLTSMLPKASGAQMLQWVMIGLIVILCISCIAIIFWYLIKKKKYKQYRVEILSRDVNGNVYKEYDRGGVFLDKKTNMRLFFIEKGKWGGNPNKIPYVSSRDNKGRIIKTVYLRKIGVNNYVFLNMKLDENGVAITVGEEDLNNAASEMTKIRKTYDKQSWLSKWGAILAAVLVILFIIILLIVLFNKFGILETVSNNLLEITNKQATITEQLYNMSQSNSFNPNAPIIVPGGS